MNLFSFRTTTLLFSVCALISGCAAMQQSFVENTCNKEGAYQKGYNEAQDRTAMNNYFANQCPPSTQDLVRQSYREGYTAAKTQKPTQINIVAGHLSDTWTCKEAYGKKSCGYDCKEAYGKIKCAKVSGNNCIESYGKITCGRFCREEYGQVKCDSYE